LDTAKIIAISGGFIQFVGGVLADLKRQELSQIDIDLLRLKSTQLGEKLDDFKRDLAAAVKDEKGHALQDLISRGLANSSLRETKLRSIEEEAKTQLDRAQREHDHAIEEIALMEKRIKTENRPAWKRFIGK
jgi:hypothetical protein